MKITVGADPEIFVRRFEENNHDFFSAHEFPCGTKYKPTKTKHGSVQIDGMALEVNVKPATEKREFIRNVKGVIHDLEEIVYDHDDNCILSFVPYVNFGVDYLNTIPIRHRVLGCNVDFNAHTMGPNPPPDADLPIRTASGHIHIGWGKFEENREHFETCCELVKELDFYLGLPSLSWDPDPHRRELYGQAGAFRPKKYGLEYRVLSNRWCDDDDTIGFVFSMAKRATKNFLKGELLYPRYKDFAKVCIDENRIEWKEKAPGLYDYLGVEEL